MNSVESSRLQADPNLDYEKSLGGNVELNIRFIASLVLGNIYYFYVNLIKRISLIFTIWYCIHRHFIYACL